MFDDRPLGARLAQALASQVSTGQSLAERFGVSRQTISQCVLALRDEGVQIRDTEAGYDIGAGGFGPLSLAWRCERPVVFHALTASTNRDAFALGLEGAPGGALVVANAQSAGKGRLGRTWVSEPGKNLTFSLLLRPPLLPQQAPLVCLAAAVAISEVTGLQIKWPNDVLAPDGRKVAGILAELHAEVGRLHFVVLGVGLNVLPQSLPEGISASCLAQESPGRAWDRALLLGQLVSRIELHVAQLTQGPESMLRAWRERSATLGQRVRVGEIQGEAVDLREDGALLVRTVDGVVPVLAGDVQMVS